MGKNLFLGDELSVIVVVPPEVQKKNEEREGQKDRPLPATFDQRGFR